MSVLLTTPRRFPAATAAAAAAIYGGFHLLWYWSTPLGRVPVLDEREMLGLAQQIAHGTLPAEPFYRAMGYPLLLSIFPALGAPDALLPFLCTALGLVLHALNSALVAKLACRAFASTPAALIAGLLHALHPVLVHYATQILDGTLANTALLLGLVAILPDQKSTPSPPNPLFTGRLALAGGAWAVCGLVRPQSLTLLPALPIVWALVHGHRSLGTKPRSLLAAGLATALPFIALGVWQVQVGGAFRILPTQGAYNLWAANRPDTDGRYFTQQVHVAASQVHRNPTLLESRILFARETGGDPEAPIDVVNAHWRERLADTLIEEPATWIRLLLRKTYYLFNDFDPYNNKTYAFHQARSPWLAPNPLGWGLLLVLATPGFWVLASNRPNIARALAFTFLALAASILLTFVSGRFRIPLLALLCIGAGGLVRVDQLSPARRWAAALGVVFVAALSFSRFAGAIDTRTFLQDHLLIASSAATSGEDEITWTESGHALRLAPTHPDALAWRVSAGFNLLLISELEREREQQWLETARKLLAGNPGPSASHQVRVIAALALWRAGDREQAVAHWAETWTRENEPSARAALLLAGATEASLPAPPDSSLRHANDAFSMMLAARDAKEASPRDEEFRHLADRLFLNPGPGTRP